jgi:hypothetical protein
VEADQGVSETAELQLICDDQGLAVIGPQADVDLFLASEGLTSRDLGLPRLHRAVAATSSAAEAGALLAENSGRWVKLTKESAEKVHKYGLRQSKDGVATGVLKGKKSQIKGFVEFAKTPGAALTNPAILAGAAGILSQLAMQQAMDEITDYLAVIDQKVDDILRGQKDAVLAPMIGVGLMVDEAMVVRDARGGVDEVTWSKVQGAPTIIAETQGHALRRLDALAEKLERTVKIPDLAEVAADGETQARDWIAVLARTFQLQDALAVLELDRVLGSDPAQLEDHRRGLMAARRRRVQLIEHTTERLIGRMGAAASRANSRVLLHPAKAPAVVGASNAISTAIGDFHARIGIENSRTALDARTWIDAAKDLRDRSLETGGEGVDAAKRLGLDARDRARSVADKVAERLVDRRGDED